MAETISRSGRHVRAAGRTQTASYRDVVDGGLVIAGKYHVVQLIAQGGMGAVYDAIHAKTGRRVALKLIKEHGLARGPAAFRRFEREAKAAGAIDSLHVVQVLDAGEDEVSGMPFFVMEHLQGEDLRTLISRGPLPPAQAITIAVQVCLGLIKAHEADIIHRDLKPANLFLAEADGNRRVVKILDFGIAKLLHEETDTPDLTITGDVVGSPPYMSPEQLVSPREVDPRSDLWSLGVVLYEMLSGASPTAGISAIGARVYAICHVPATPLTERVPGISPELAAVVHRALALDPADRFASASEMLDALRALQPDGDVSLDAERTHYRARPLSSTPPFAVELAPTEAAPPPDVFSRARWGAGVGAIALAVLVTLGGAYVAVHTRGAAAAGTSEPATASVIPEPTAADEPAAPSSLPGADKRDTRDGAEARVAATAATAAKSSASPRSPAGGARKLGGHTRAKATEADAGVSAAPRVAPTKTTGREEL
jgi:serine/threonine protein kinase